MSLNAFGWETLWNYAPTADARSTDCFAGASTIRVTPMATSTADF